MNEVEIVFNKIKIKGIWRDAVDESVWAEIFKWREYRAAENVIKQSNVSILDVGAHVGFFALYCLSLNQKAKLYCVEPESNNIKFLKKNLELNNLNKSVKILPGALMGSTNKYCLKLSPDNHNHRVYLEVGEEIKADVQGYDFIDLIKKLKIKQVDLLKMDIEGEEYELFSIWNEKEFSLIKNIVLEYHESEDNDKEYLVNILRENGFGVQVFPSRFDNTMGIIFANNKRIK